MAADPYQRAVAEAARVQADYIEQHPFVESIMKGTLTPAVYAAYLRETYHLVTQTPYFLSAARHTATRNGCRTGSSTWPGTSATTTACACAT
ncbi:hypothetical protein ACFQ3Z_01135 [Streptomyces nogalater]